MTVRLKQVDSLEGCPAGAGGVQPGFAGRLGAGFTVRLKQPDSLEGCPAGAGGVQPGFAGRLGAGFTVIFEFAGGQKALLAPGADSFSGFF